MIRTIPLPIRLLVFGNGPEVAPLRDLSAALGWDLRIFPHPDDLPEGLHGDSQTAGLVMNHHFGRDLASLDSLSRLGLNYIGLLGPRKRNSRLVAQWHDLHPGQWEGPENLHAPAGLDIGSEAPEEIALSIVSEISAVLAKRQGGFLRERAAAIHLGMRAA